MQEAAINPSPSSGASSIIERLIGATGEPEVVVKAGRTIAERILKPLRASLEDAASEAVPVEIEDVAVERTTELLVGAGQHDALTVGASQTSPDAFSIRLEAKAIAVLVNALFGAEAEVAAGGIERDLSPVEVEVANLVCRLLAVAYNGFNGPAQRIKLPLPAVASGDGLKEFAVRDGPGLRIDFAVGAEAERGRISVFMPQRIVLQRGGEDASDPAQAEAQSAEWAAKFNEEVMRARVTLQATLSVGRMTLGQVAAFRRGQVIELSRTAPTETRLSARNKQLFVCEFGRLDENYTVRIKTPVAESQDIIDGLVSP
ncbi:flagellar motor switch protein FliM [Aquibium carbonis]|uniref:Flagellar motor switch protein FliM n=1 Tax=Aquibium carbonis TaxID=2495581 RepID=A0A3R9Y7H7_9HYPH|nr:FliM/FliN family flagellar motor switch protein [Aquibium carbonis]RST85863.1 flagellar motor switch protein FliM [Aquibium carbonis]